MLNDGISNCLFFGPPKAFGKLASMNVALMLYPLWLPTLSSNVASLVPNDNSFPLNSFTVAPFSLVIQSLVTLISLLSFSSFDISFISNFIWAFLYPPCFTDTFLTSKVLRSRFLKLGISR